MDIRGKAYQKSAFHRHRQSQFLDLVVLLATALDEHEQAADNHGRHSNKQSRLVLVKSKDSFVDEGLLCFSSYGGSDGSLREDKKIQFFILNQSTPTE